MKNHTITITLNEQEEAFLRKFAKRDGVTIRQELLMMLQTEFDQCRVLYEEELADEG